MNKTLEKINLNDIQEIKLDKTIQNFLERRNFENFDIKNMEVENSSNIEFIKISHISYDREKDISDLQLIDFQQILSAIASKSQKIVYMLEGTINGVSLYLGTSQVDFLKDTFEGIYSGSTTNHEKPNFDTSYTSAKAMLGIPALKRDSDKSFKQSLERILFPMQGKEFRLTLIAEAYQLETIQEIISNYQNLGNELHQFVKQTKNMQKSIASTEGTGKSIGTTKGNAVTEGSTTGALQQSAIDRAPTSLIGASAGGVALITGVASGGTLSAIGGVTGGAIGTYLTAGIASATAGATPLVGAGVMAGGATTGATAGAFILPALAVGAAAVGSVALAKTLFGGKTNTKGTSKSQSKTNSTTLTDSTNKSDTKTDTFGITFDEINKSAEYCEELIDHYIERFQKGLNHGMWNSSLYIEAKDETILSELEHTLKSVYSGDESYYETIRFSDTIYDVEKKISKNIDFDLRNLPMIYMKDSILTHPIHPSFSGFSTAVNTEELSLLTALPNNDIDGISVSKISSFGLTQNLKSDISIDVGYILNKKKKTSQRFFLSKEAVNSHIFVSGLTGSGKSNTIKLILEQLNSKHQIPFLVIEPAKSEYKHLLSSIASLQIFRPGAKNDIFRFNPFIFEYSKNENSVSLIQHVDMLKTTFNSAFPMYGPMPYILEEAIHKIYEDKGWNFTTQHHSSYSFSEHADYDRKSMLFPTMDDLKNKIDSVVEDAGYYQDLENNIKAALKTRINNLTIGTKGKIFNSKHAFSSNTLFEKPTIIELSNIVDDEEKSFLMGLLLNKLYQYRLEQISGNELKHVTVIEEAHRLLPNLSVSNNQESSDTRAKAVETFTNVLAEIRSLGEGMIIADQIASKLHADVIKNTNVKILHRTMSKDDRDIVGEAVNLTENQILDVAELKTGEAIVHNKDIHQAFMVKIDEKKEILISAKELEGFYKDFLQKNENYKYEYIDEVSFYNENYLVDIMNKKELLKRKMDLIEFLNIVLTKQYDLVQSKWDLFYNKFNFKQKRVISYQVAQLWRELNFIGNYEYYIDADSYIKTTKTFMKLIGAISQDKEWKKHVDKFVFTYEHENVKSIYSSMQKYDNENIDYTLIILENLTNNEEVWTLNQNIFEDDTLSFNKQCDIFTNKVFGINNDLLKKSLIAIKLGSSNIDINNIIREDV